MIQKVIDIHIYVYRKKAAAASNSLCVPFFVVYVREKRRLFYPTWLALPSHLYRSMWIYRSPVGSCNITEHCCMRVLAVCCCCLVVVFVFFFSRFSFVFLFHVVCMTVAACCWKISVAFGCLLLRSTVCWTKIGTLFLLSLYFAKFPVYIRISYCTIRTNVLYEFS